MAGRGDVGDADRHTIVEQVEDLADEDAGVERERLARFDHNVEVGLRAHPLPEGDEVVGLRFGAGDGMDAAGMDSFAGWASREEDGREQRWGRRWEDVREQGG